MMLVFGDGVIEWARLRMPLQSGFDMPYGFGVMNPQTGVLMCAVVFDNYRPLSKSVCVSLAIDDKRGFTRGLLRAVSHYAFIQLGCNRITAMIDCNNKRSLDVTRRVGFVEEGVMREQSPAGGDMIVFGMLKRECKWLS